MSDQTSTTGPDVAPVSPQAYAPGKGSTEHTLTKMAMGIGSVLATTGTVLGQLPQDNKAVCITTQIIGALMAILALFGYTKGRSDVKAAAAGAQN